VLGMQYTVNLLANMVEDGAGNENAASSASFTVRTASSLAKVTSSTYTVDQIAETITDVPFSDDLATFKGNIIPAAGASFEVYQTDGTTLAIDLQDEYKLIATAEDATTTKTYTIGKNAFVNDQTDILSFVLAEQTGDAVINAVDHTVVVEVPFGTNLSALVATYSLSSGANAKVADYAFTTLDPNLGDFYGYVIADIPGLIEGASTGKGLGIKFLKHIEKVRLLLHCISIESEDILHDYESVRKEMGDYNKKLLEKKSIVILTKIDLIDEKSIKNKCDILQKAGIEVIPMSVHDFDRLEKLKKTIGSF